MVKEKLAAIIRTGFLPILVEDTLDPIFLAGICQEIGLPAIEYTQRREDLRQILPRLNKEFPNLMVLAASVIDDDKVVSFIKNKRDFLNLRELQDLGVDGIVSMLPFRKETYEIYRENLLMIPGVETAAEAFQQLSWGAHLIKFFNTEVFGGPRRIAFLQAPTHKVLPIVITGGITPDRVGPYLESGALVIGAGFDTILGEQYHKMQENPDKAFIRQQVKSYRAAVVETRGKLGQSRWGEIADADTLLKATNRFFPL